MSIVKVVKNLKFSYLKTVFWFGIKHPLFSLATLQATIITFKISQQKFPNKHGKENKANAFRHALWNMLILKKSLVFTNDVSKAETWTKKITDLHEELSPNRAISRAMDLKNNELGRHWIKVNLELSDSEIVKFLENKLQEAQKISKISEIAIQSNLVYLEE